jgi:hypothetical protein
MSRRTRLMPQRTIPAKAPVTIVRVPPVGLAEAIRLANGDRSRIRLQRDGSVIVD